MNRKGILQNPTSVPLKNSQKTRNKVDSLILKEATMRKLQLMSSSMMNVSPMIRSKTRVSALITSVGVVSKALSSAFRTEKEIERMQIGKEEGKLSLF